MKIIVLLKFFSDQSEAHHCVFFFCVPTHPSILLAYFLGNIG